MYAAILQSYLEGDQTALLALRDYALDEGLDDQAQMWETVIEGRERIDSLTPAEEALLDAIAQYWVALHQRAITSKAPLPPCLTGSSMHATRMLLSETVQNAATRRVMDQVWHKVLFPVLNEMRDTVKNVHWMAYYHAFYVLGLRSLGDVLPLKSL